MLAHGKLASPFVHSNHAPVSKVVHVGGAGPNANSRARKSVKAKLGPSVGAIERLVASKRHHEECQRRKTTQVILDSMLAYAKALNDKASDNPDDAIMLRWLAQDIAAGVARRSAEGMPDDNG